MHHRKENIVFMLMSTTFMNFFNVHPFNIFRRREEGGGWLHKWHWCCWFEFTALPIDLFEPRLIPRAGGTERAKGGGGEALCVEMGFYTDVSWELRCNIEINVWAHFFVLFLKYLIDPKSKGFLEKAKTTKKWYKDGSNIASCYDSDIDGIVCVKQIGLGSARTLKKC